MATTLSSWTIDPVHSSVEFSLDYMGFSTYRTGFRALEGRPHLHGGAQPVVLDTRYLGQAKHPFSRKIVQISLGIMAVGQD